ncbi:MAG: retropepsin-like domain-containing protein, partial [Acidobacteriota bacterium]|nr:retropepsin-like domain-containing protein [Acidobacteriota bacterium]
MLPLCGAVKIQMVEGRPLLGGVYLNGHGPYRFLIDTGTTMNHLDPGVAKAIGLKAAFRTELVSSAGVTYAPGAGGITVTVDRVRADSQSFLFAGLDAVQQTYPNVRGVLGEEFLTRFDFLLAVRQKQIDFKAAEPANGGTRTRFERMAGRA